jgi:hypothetical protein
MPESNNGYGLIALIALMAFLAFFGWLSTRQYITEYEYDEEGRIVRRIEKIR